MDGLGWDVKGHYNAGVYWSRKLFGPLDTQHDRDVDGPARRLTDDPVLAEKRDRLVTRAVNGDLSVLDDTEPALEADLCARVQAEQVARDLADTGVERLRKPVRHAE